MEKKSQKIIAHKKFVFRLFKYSLFAFILIVISIAIGVVGYHYYAHLSLIDSFHMSCLILTGMGPTDPMPTDSAKLFSSFYALYSGISFLTSSAIVFTPVIHRVLHILHIEENEEK